MCVIFDDQDGAVARASVTALFHMRRGARRYMADCAVTRVPFGYPPQPFLSPAFLAGRMPKRR